MKISFRKLKWLLKKQGPNLVFDEYIELDMTELPNGIQSITTKGGLQSDKLTKLPDGITIKADMSVRLDGLTTMGSNVTIETYWSVSLHRLTTMGNDVAIKVGYMVFLNSLTVIGNNVKIEAKESVRFENLTTIGNNVIIETSGFVELNNLMTIGDNVVIKANWHIRLNKLTRMGSNVRIKADRTIYLDGLNSLGDNVIERVVLNYKDRLVRNGFELIEQVCQLHDVEIEIINLTENSNEQELVEDVLAIITVYSAKLYGSRSHKNKTIVDTNKSLFTKKNE